MAPDSQLWEKSCTVSSSDSDKLNNIHISTQDMISPPCLPLSYKNKPKDLLNNCLLI